MTSPNKAHFHWGKSILVKGGLSAASYGVGAGLLMFGAPEIVAGILSGAAVGGAYAAGTWFHKKYKK